MYTSYTLWYVYQCAIVSKTYWVSLHFVS